MIRHFSRENRRKMMGVGMELEYLAGLEYMEDLWNMMVFNGHDSGTDSLEVPISYGRLILQAHISGNITKKYGLNSGTVPLF